MVHEDCGMSIKTKGGKIYERESVRQTKKRKRERRKRKKEGNLPFKNAKNPKQLNHTTKLISKFVVKKDSFTLEAMEQKKRQKEKTEKRESENKKIKKFKT